jgi:hypothetical protein
MPIFLSLTRTGFCLEHADTMMMMMTEARLSFFYLTVLSREATPLSLMPLTSSITFARLMGSDQQRQQQAGSRVLQELKREMHNWN